LEANVVDIVKQVSVFLENKPGRLANILSTLAQEKVNITALTVMDSHEHSVLRFVTGDMAPTVRVLNNMNLRHAETDVISVEMRNQPGSLAQVCERLAQEHINIDYAYCSSGGRNGKTVGIFKVAHAEKAGRVLNGVVTTANRKRMERRPLRDRRSYQSTTVGR
jgi:hypothetical protein